MNQWTLVSTPRCCAQPAEMPSLEVPGFDFASAALNPDWLVGAWCVADRLKHNVDADQQGLSAALAESKPGGTQLGISVD